MSEPPNDRIIIVGAGLAGPLLGIYLARRGAAVTIYEARPSWRAHGADTARSINLAVSARGLAALRQVGLETIVSGAVPMYGRMIHTKRGVAFQPYDADPSRAIFSMRRSRLHAALLDAAEREPRVTVRYECECTAYEPGGTVELRTGGRTFRDHGVAIAADGAASIVRTSLLRRGIVQADHRYLDVVYKELPIPPGSGLARDVFHVWPRGSRLLIALPNDDGGFTSTMFLPLDETRPAGPDDLGHSHFSDVPELTANLDRPFPTRSFARMSTVQCSPWREAGYCLLIGDAAHAVSPFLGQGMNAAMEDCAILDRCVDEVGADWETVFETFERRRKPDTDALLRMSDANERELGASTVENSFLVRKAVERRLAQLFPGRFVPRYSMITFQQVPYAVAERYGRLQDEILDELCTSLDAAEDLDLARAAHLMEMQLDRAELPRDHDAKPDDVPELLRSESRAR